MDIASKTSLLQIIIQCAGTQDIIKKLGSCGPCGRKNVFKLVAFLLRLSIFCLPFQGGSFMLFMSCFCYAFVRVCLLMPCGHLLEKG